MLFPQLRGAGWVMAGALVVAACGDEDPAPARDASQDVRDAGGDPSGDAGRDASREDARDARMDEEPDAALPPIDQDAGHDASVAPGEDAGCLAFVMPSDLDCSAPSDGVLPKDLRCTGLYGRMDALQPACGVLEYAPAYALWSDGAQKRRFASIPDGKKIDVSDPDAFVYPDGTTFWKEFSVDGRKVETRLQRKTPEGWLYTSYVWNAAQTQALQMDNATGVPDVDGTGHVVPSRDQCNECHGGRADFVLGWDAIMLGPGAEGVTRETMAQLGLIDGALPALEIPGNDVEKAALGYLHANCGISCHNDSAAAEARDSGLFLRLERGELASVQSTDAFTTGMNKVPSPNAKLEGLPPLPMGGTWLGIRPGQPDRSLLVARQRLRGVEGQMPRIATKIVDQDGVQKVVDWIEAMPEIGGYPAADP